jgi:hypothetical protein
VAKFPTSVALAHHRLRKTEDQTTPLFRRLPVPGQPEQNFLHRLRFIAGQPQAVVRARARGREIDLHILAGELRVGHVVDVDHEIADLDEFHSRGG